MKETWTEKALKMFVFNRGGWGQKVQSGSIKTTYRNKFGVSKVQIIHLADKGTPDTIFCIPKVITADMVGQTIGVFTGVEVKNSAVEVKKWKSLQARHLDGEMLPASYDREEAQIKMAKKITQAGGKHFVVGSLVDFIDQAGPEFNNFVYGED